MSPLRDRYLTELSIDVDRLGVHALEETARRLELLPLKRPDADSCKPSTLRLQCSHGVARSAATVMPTFKARDPRDRRLRKPERLSAGRALVKAFVKHVAVNDSISVLEISHAPLRYYDWQQLVAGLKASGAVLTTLILTGSELLDAGLALLLPFLLSQTKLTHLAIDGCGLTDVSKDAIMELLWTSNNRQEAYQLKLAHQEEFEAWAATLRGARSRRMDVKEEAERQKEAKRHGKKGLARGPSSASLFAQYDDPEEEEQIVGLEYFNLAGNALGEEIGIAIANHLMVDYFLKELDLRRCGLTHAALDALNTVLEERQDESEERLLRLGRQDMLVMPDLKCPLEGNAVELDAARAMIEAELRRDKRGPHSHKNVGASTFFKSKSSYSYARAGFNDMPPARPMSARLAKGNENAVALEREAKRMRAKLSAKSKLAGGKAEELSRKLAAATAAKGPTQRAAGQVTNREWKELIKLSGGPGRLLDALEGVAAALIEKEVGLFKASEEE